MRIAAIPRQATVIDHLRALVGCVIVALVALVLLQYDRRPPFEYVDTFVEPNPVAEGGELFIHRTVRWFRHCDGEIYREVVRPTGVVAEYDRGYRPFPYSLGQQSASSSFHLPASMLAKGQDHGVATYRGRVRFTDCGLTSRIWPIEVAFQPMMFEVVRAARH
jgi:hypothetical protein